jgi:hypothetical protein
MSNERETFLRLFEIAVSDERHHYESYHRHVRFHVGLVTAIGGATATGVLDNPTWYRFLAIPLASLAIVFVSRNAIRVSNTGYRRFLEAVTIRAKIEHRLGLWEAPTSQPGSPWWESEPIVPRRHREDRADATSSENFVKSHMTSGSHSHYVGLLRAIECLGWTLLALSAVSLAAVAVCPEFLAAAEPPLR